MFASRLVFCMALVICAFIQINAQELTEDQKTLLGNFFRLKGSIKHKMANATDSVIDYSKGFAQRRVQNVANIFNRIGNALSVDNGENGMPTAMKPTSGNSNAPTMISESKPNMMVSKPDNNKPATNSMVAENMYRNLHICQSNAKGEPTNCKPLNINF